MNQHEDFHGQMIIVALLVAVCTLAAVLIFFAWLERSSKRKRDGKRNGKTARPVRKKRH